MLEVWTLNGKNGAHSGPVFETLLEIQTLIAQLSQTLDHCVRNLNGHPSKSEQLFVRYSDESSNRVFRI